MCRWLLGWLEAGNCTDFWLGSLHVNRILTCPKLGGERHLEVEEIWRSSGGFRPRRSWKLYASCFPWPLEWHQCKVNPAKSLETKQKNEGKWTLFIWLSFGGFWGWNVTICGIYETFLGITCVLRRLTLTWRESLDMGLKIYSPHSLIRPIDSGRL